MTRVEIAHAEISRRLGPVTLVVLVLGVVILQQYGLSFREFRASAPTERMLHSQEIHDPGIAPLTLECKAAVRIARLDASGDSDPETDKAMHADMLRDLDETAETPGDRLRVAIVAGELLGKDEAIRRLSDVAGQVEPGSPLALDIYWFNTVYKAKARPELPSDAWAALLDRHGWFAQLALANGLPDEDATRRSVVGGGMRVVALSFGAYLVGIRNGDWECVLEATELPGWAYLEMFNAFLAWFTLLLAFQIVTLFLTGPASVAGMAVGELLLWATPLCLFWPRIRGLDWGDVKADLGLNAGAGIGTEMKAGLLGFLASLPLILFVHWAGSKVEAAISGQHSQAGYSPFESPLSHSWIPLILGSLGAVCWAPMVEEILFRGALFRSFRLRLGRWGAILLSAVIFGAIHPYSLSGLLGTLAAGLVFGLLREWRGSLVAPMTAHFLNNAAIMAMQVLYVLAVD